MLTYNNKNFNNTFNETFNNHRAIIKSLSTSEYLESCATVLLLGCSPRRSTPKASQRCENCWRLSVGAHGIPWNPPKQLFVKQCETSNSKNNVTLKTLKIKKKNRKCCYNAVEWSLGIFRFAFELHMLHVSELELLAIPCLTVTYQHPKTVKGQK